MQDDTLDAFSIVLHAVHMSADSPAYNPKPDAHWLGEALVNLLVRLEEHSISASDAAFSM
jgi:hypothetical protein